MKTQTGIAVELAVRSEPNTNSLDSDPRWQLVNRIADSPSLSRAKQLREFLLYSSRCALVTPGKSLSESEIAQNVMGRRDDFDAAHDNIVRVQATHLRRRLETFFATEGRDEETIITLPKGTYTPVFSSSKPKQALEPRSLEPEHVAPPPSTPFAYEAPVAPGTPSSQSTRWMWVVVAVLSCVCLALTVRLIVIGEHAKTNPASRANTQTILTPLLRNGKPITVVLPDLGLSVVQNLLHREIDPQDYASGRFPESSLQDVTDPKLREALNYIGVRRATSYSELNGVLDLVGNLRSAGVSPSVRFARDIHVRDLGTDNIILMGSRRSNPWVSLYADRTNFQFDEDPNTHEFRFINQNPQGQEQKIYVPTYTPRGGDAYIDIAILSNTTDTGYVLLVDGSDAEVNESAVRYLLDGNISSQLREALNRPRLKSLEVFLRGRHLVNEADNDITVIGFRQTSAE